MPTVRAVSPEAKKSVTPKSTPGPVKRHEVAQPDDRNLRDDAVVDRRIIEGMLHDRSVLMTEMKALGHDEAAVLRRAAELGLSEAMIRQVTGVVADLAGDRAAAKVPPPTMGARTCLCCDRTFLSAGPSNRLCMRCRGGDAGLAAL